MQKIFSKGTFAGDLMSNRKLVNNSREMSLRIHDQIDKAIRFMEQSKIRLKA